MSLLVTTLTRTTRSDLLHPNTSRLGKLRGPGLEITPVNGSQADNALLGFTKKPAAGAGAGSASKGSKLESALDRLGFQKRKVTLRLTVFGLMASATVL